MKQLLSRLTEEFSDKNYAHAYFEDHVNTLLAAQIKAMREQRGWTQEELARRAGMKQERISALENVDYGSWTISTLRKLARAFDVSVSAHFEPFSESIRTVASLTAAKLKVESREDDLRKFRASVLISDEPRHLSGGLVRTERETPPIESASNDNRWTAPTLLVLPVAA